VVWVALVGGIAALVAIGLAVSPIATTLRCRAYMATVTDFAISDVRGNVVTVRFATDDGDIEVTDDGVFSRYTEGQTVRVLVAPGSDPLRVIVPEFVRFWLGPVIAGAIAIVLVAVAVLG